MIASDHTGVCELSERSMLACVNRHCFLVETTFPPGVQWAIPGIGFGRLWLAAGAQVASTVEDPGLALNCSRCCAQICQSASGMTLAPRASWRPWAPARASPAPTCASAARTSPRGVCVAVCKHTPGVLQLPQESLLNAACWSCCSPPDYLLPALGRLPLVIYSLLCHCSVVVPEGQCGALGGDCEPGPQHQGQPPS